MAILLRILLMLIVVYYIIAFITRAIPSLFYSDYDPSKVSSKKKQEQKRAKKNEGEITIKYIPEKQRKYGTAGEYTDYEEVKD